MTASVEDLKAKYKGATATTATESPKKDRGIKGTLLDDYAIEIAMKALTLVAILVLGSIGYLWLERAVGAGKLTPFRIWFPVIGWAILAFTHKPFLRFGWWGLLATLSILPTVSGYLWQLFQAMVGTR